MKKGKTTKRSNVRRRKRFLGFFVFFIALLLCVAVTISVTMLFPVKRLVINNESIYTKEEISDASGISGKSNVLLLSKTNVANKISKNLPLSGEITIEKVFPNTVRLIVKTAVPEYYMVKDGSYFVFDTNFKCIETASEPPENCMLIKTKNKIKAKAGEILKLDDTDSKIMEEILTPVEKTVKVTGIDLSDELDIKFIVDNRVIVQLGSTIDINYKIKHFVAMYEKMSDSAKGIANLKGWTSTNAKATFRDVKIDVEKFCEMTSE